MRKKNGDDKEDDEGGGGDGSSGGAGSGTWIPNYYELLGLNADEKELGDLASQAVFEQRLSLKSQGEEVTALSKMQKLRNQLREPGLENSAGASIALEEHPELADMGGDVDPNNIVLPESEAAERASNDPKLQNKLKARMAAKFGMSQNISLQSMQEEYKNKMKQRSQPQPSGQQPKPEPRYVFTEAPPPPKPLPKLRPL